tara:strand:+ start:2587 stop:4419 length:1833 start_codon:yes stop_codon:yes gene_type:complete
MADNTDFTLPKDAYATFDALTLKSLIKQRLREGGTFTDQDFEGSNLSAIIDIIALSYHLSLFYLNQTSSESLFNESTVFENINRITKLIGYKPTGYKTAVLPFEAEASSRLPVNVYTIKRYSYFSIDGTDYSFIKDATFSKTNIADEQLTTLSENTLLYQGKYIENPVLTAIGEEFETVTLLVRDNINQTPVNIEADSIGVYIQNANTNKYNEFAEIDSLFNATNTSYVFEKRLNENGFYEIKFGNGVNGIQLQTGDKIFLYYLKSNGIGGKVSAGKLDGNNLNVFTTTQFEAITPDIYESNILILTPNLASAVAFTNSIGATSPGEIETVKQIKENAPRSFFAQNRIVTNDDFQAFVEKRYSNIITSTVLVSNESFIDTVIKYYYDLGLDRPNRDSRFLFNQVKFSTTNQANQVYAFMVPKIKIADSDNNLFYLTQAQKSEVINTAQSQKIINSEIQPMDPVYVGVTIGLQDSFTDKPSLNDIEYSELIIQRKQNNRISAARIIEEANNVFEEAFDPANVKLGDTLNITAISTKILAIEGVAGLRTVKRSADTGEIVRSVPFLNIYNFNAAYADVDIASTGSNVSLPYFKFPFLYSSDLKSRINVEIID